MRSTEDLVDLADVTVADLLPLSTLTDRFRVFIEYLRLTWVGDKTGSLLEYTLRYCLRWN